MVICTLGCYWEYKSSTGVTMHTDFLDKSEAEMPPQAARAYRENSNNRTMGYVVRNFLHWKGGEEHQTSAPETTKKKEKSARSYHTMRGNSNAPAQCPTIPVLTVPSLVACPWRLWQTWRKEQRGSNEGSNRVSLA